MNVAVAVRAMTCILVARDRMVPMEAKSLRKSNPLHEQTKNRQFILFTSFCRYVRRDDSVNGHGI